MAVSAKELPSLEYLNDCFEYVSETGVLVWKVRPLKHFRCGQGCKMFNTAYSGKEAGTLEDRKDRNTSRRTVRLFNKHFMVHRIIWKLVTGKDVTRHIDHINGNGLDNRFENLREATNAENLWNVGASCKNKTGYKGVSRHRTRYQACIKVNGKNMYLGHFETPEEAHKAFRIAADKYHKDFANYG